jgi:Ca2+-binding RTX toxin-like protein
MSYTIASFEPNPGVTYVANAVWHDGLVTDVAVANSTVIGNSNASFTFWRTFTTVGPLSEGLVEAELHIRGSDGTLRLVESIGSVINTIILQPDPVQQSELTLIVGGLDNVNDQILFEPATVNSQPAARVYYNGSDMGAFAVERLIVYGQGGDDLIQVNAAIGLDARLYGQAGNDILVGGAGHDILIGGIGNDILYGFGGRDLVFGGLGQDFVQGAGFSGSAVGDDSDIVVGGYVTFDLEPKKLNDLALLWRSPSASYEDRITAARTTTFGLRYNETVFDDWSLDYVFGATDLDWFLVESTRDNIDAQSDETIN